MVIKICKDQTNDKLDGDGFNEILCCTVYTSKWSSELVGSGGR